MIVKLQIVAMAHGSFDELIDRLERLANQQKEFLKLPFFIGFNHSTNTNIRQLVLLLN